ncbi:hypothetical protein PAXRUDRAFT_149107 [Paxillus rubicundulus Ve08.2h10]|uniref:Uncharacterized protein n=1 Tax=Paxillus rubicundulus Ve08.2h10 TaxID=930991 RepID=A0A0D0D4V8_9AGAM|nr:hypothetical protein PAXRUDRAFT_149107 [Paxillus rubicundulus Ve08.2h10]
MDATSANSVLNATAKTIVDLLCGKVQGGEWGMVVKRMGNAMNTTHVDVIHGIVIAVEQLLHPQNAAWPHWMAMIEWTHKLVACHAWARNGRIVCMAYEFGTTSNNDKECLQQPKEVSAREEETRRAETLEMKMEDDVDDVADVVYMRQ